MAGHGSGQGGGRNRGYQASVGGNTVEVAGAIEKATLGPLAQTALTAAGVTPAHNVTGLSKISWGIVIASIDTSVTLRIEGSEDGTSYFNMNDDGSDTIITADGTYELRGSGRSIMKTRCRMVSESGGTNVTVTATLTALE